ncbi:MAG TPA: hypothetical protein VFC46_06845 [Humisphaera sp.]|nr:hypothetical protein [Humisphaera sp.]
MKIEFQITESEYGEAVRAMNRSLRDWYRPLRIGGIIASGVGMAFLFGADRSNWIAPALLALFGLFVPIYPVLVVSRSTNDGWLRYSVNGIVTWEFDDDGITFRSELAVSLAMACF